MFPCSSEPKHTLLFLCVVYHNLPLGAHCSEHLNRNVLNHSVVSDLICKIV